MPPFRTLTNDQQRASFTAMAYEAFGNGAPGPELQAMARAEIERRGLRPAIDRANAQIDAAFGRPAKSEAA